MIWHGDKWRLEYPCHKAPELPGCVGLGIIVRAVCRAFVLCAYFIVWILFSFLSDLRIPDCCPLVFLVGTHVDIDTQQPLFLLQLLGYIILMACINSSSNSLALNSLVLTEAA